MADYSPLLQGGIEGLDALTQILRERRLKNEAEQQRQLIRSERVADEEAAFNRDQARGKAERERLAIEQKAGYGAAQKVLAPETVTPSPEQFYGAGQQGPFAEQSIQMPVTKGQMLQRAAEVAPSLSPEAIPAFKSGLSFWQDPNADHLAELENQLKEFQVQEAGVKAQQALPESLARIRNLDEPNRAEPKPSKTLDPLTRQKVADYNRRISSFQKILDDKDNPPDPTTKAATQAAISGFTRARDKLLGAQEVAQPTQVAQLTQSDWTSNLDPEDIAAIEEARAKGYTDDEIKALMQGE